MTIVSWLYEISCSGVDFTESENGGIECRDAHGVSGYRRFLESFFVSVVALGLLAKGYTHSSNSKASSSSVYSPLRICLLTVLSFVFGCEVAYKVASRRAIFLMNPCHLISVLQILLLSSSSSSSSSLFTFVFHVVHGPLVALLFPETNTLSFPLEKTLFYVQHTLIVLTPFLLLLFDSESSRGHDYSWNNSNVSFGYWALYHYAVMTPLSYFTLANIGSMLCPYLSDPFAGPNYTLYGLAHQFALIHTLGLLLRLIRRTKEKLRQRKEF